MVAEIPLGNVFNLEETLNSGQVFHWENFSVNGVPGCAACMENGSVSWIAQPEPDLLLTLKGDADRVSRYLGLDHDLPALFATYPKEDVFLERAIEYCPGIRIIRQPIWECLATFITSSLKQVAHIRGISLTLRERYGERHELDGRKMFYDYPSPETLAAAGEAALRKCALGYRAKSLHRAAVAVARGDIDLVALEKEPNIDLARKSLIQLHGVGDKIANCVLLFGCGRWETFPIDVWIERVLRDHYRKRIRGIPLRKWAENYFGPNAGYAQQYLFHFARKTL